jgi:uncharacterized membrane protein HdeD (DUF308 family)
MPEVAGWIAEARRNAGWLILLGIIEIIIGILAIATPLMAGLAVTIMVAVLLLLAGVSRLVAALKAGSWGAGILGFLVGILALAGGIIMLARPGAGLAWITWLLSLYFFVVGLSGIALALKIRPHHGWGWRLFNGILSLLLGILIMGEWPLSGAWAVGVLVGIHFLFSGWAMLFVGLGMRRLPE